VAAARYLSDRKRAIQAEEPDFASAREILETLEDINQQIFSPGDLVPTLSRRETWAVLFGANSSPQARAARVGQFLRRFRLKSRRRTRVGTQFSRAETIEAIARHLPD